MRDEDLLSVSWEESLDRDDYHFIVRSRHFGYRRGIALSGIDYLDRDYPPPDVVCGMTTGVFAPLFRAFAGMPFPPDFIAPLLQQLMDPLLDRWWVNLRQRAGQRRVLVSREVVRDDLMDMTPRRIVRLQADASRHRAAHAMDVYNALDAELSQVLMGVDMATQQQQNITQIFRHPMAARVMMDELYGTFSTPVVDEATKRAREMLIACLSEKQRRQFLATEEFEVLGSDRRLYRITPKHSFNVVDVSNRAEYCAVPEKPCPVYDKMMASKLWLETNVAGFKAVANRRGGGMAARFSDVRFFPDFVDLVRNPAAVARIIA